MPHRTAKNREKKQVSANGVMYAKDAKTGTLFPRTMISEVQFARNIREISGSLQGIRTLIFPAPVRTVKQESFYGI